MKRACLSQSVILYPIFYFINTQNLCNAYVTENCITSNGMLGKCLPRYQCNSKLSQDESMPKIKFSKIYGSVCSFGFQSFMTCCPFGNHNVLQSIDEALMNEFPNNVEDKKNTYNKNHRRKSQTELINDNKVPHFPKTFYPPFCGWSKGEHDRVVGGSEAQLGSWPWIATMGYNIDNKPKDDDFFCGATLISSRHVVTAAHCVDEDDVEYVIRLGDQNLESDKDGAHPIDARVKKAFPHPKYNKTSKVNDIAVLTLDKDVEFTDSIHPICLPLADDIKNHNFTGFFPFVAGWGSTYYGGPPSDVLRETQVPILDNSRCEEAYSKMHVIVDKRSLCAGYLTGGKDACQGDSGGPLMFPHNMSFYLIGVVSTGFHCASAGYPGLYTRVSEFLHFIYDNIQ